MISLVLEASTYAGSVALMDGNALLAERSVAMRGRDREALMPAAAELLATRGLAPAALGRIVCGAGPGSFTSLRIAGGIAKGLAVGLAIPLVPVSSLALLVASRSGTEAGRYLAAIDALRGEHYVALFDVEADGAIQTASLSPSLARVASVELETLAQSTASTLIRAGDGMAGTVVPRAAAAARITKLIDATPSADLAAWEPAYGRLAEAQVKWEAAQGRPLVVP